MLKFQAHKGVSCENPENTMSAYAAAITQGYDTIEMDVSVTGDMRFVMLHDSTLSRCGRTPEGGKLSADINIRDIDYKDAEKYDFGLHFSRKFKGEKLPLLENVLALCRENSVFAKIDNKYQSFTPAETEKFFGIIKDFEDTAQLTCNDISALRYAAEAFPRMHFHYDGEVSEELLAEISSFIPKERLTVWLPLKNEKTSWVKVAFADKEKAELVKAHGRLGLWLLSTAEELKEAEALGADIIETNGELKPEMNLGIIADLHTHSLCSHDSNCPVEDMQAAQKARGTHYMATTDHCDTFYHPKSFVRDEIINSYNNSKAAAQKNPDSTKLLTGVELGDGTIYGDVAQDMADMLPYDVVIGSVHGVEFEGVPFYYSQVDFSKFSAEDIYRYLDLYFQDMLRLVETQDIDIMAHLTCPIRYISGKYGISVDLDRYEDIIHRILTTIIRKGIALEVNTSSYHMIDDFMPGRKIIHRYKELGGYLVTLGSDAHIAENASVNFELALSFLKDEGFAGIYLYRDRCPVICSFIK